MLQLNHLVKTFTLKKQQFHAVNDVSLHINKGDIFGVIGFSGAGKSTLIRLINLLETPNSGEIILNNQDLTRLSKSQLRKTRQSIGMVFQNFNLLWSRTVFDNIALPLEIAKVPKPEIKSRVSELIKLVGLEGKEHAYPSMLSGGQKQRVGIARAIANKPQLLLCDEATSALDPKTTDSILNLLKDINRQLDITIILITHEMHVIQKICDHVAVMENGQIIEQGAVIDVFTSPVHDTTKAFIHQVETNDTDDVIHHLKMKFNDGEIIKLNYVNEEQYEEPIISYLIKHYNLTVNILHGNIVQTAVGSYGTLYLQVIGKRVSEAYDYLQQLGVQVEVIDNV